MVVAVVVAETSAVTGSLADVVGRVGVVVVWSLLTVVETCIAVVSVDDGNKLFLDLLSLFSGYFEIFKISFLFL